MNNQDKAQKPGLPERLKVIGGLVAVGVGVAAVTTIAIVAMSLTDDEVATIASSAGGIIASIVGAYFGVKIGSDQAKEANKSKDAQAAKAEVYALNLPEGDAKDMRREAETAAAAALGM
jgi:hypothetical protein